MKYPITYFCTAEKSRCQKKDFDVAPTYTTIFCMLAPESHPKRFWFILCCRSVSALRAIQTGMPFSLKAFLLSFPNLQYHLIEMPL